MVDPQEIFDRATADHEHVKATVEDIFDDEPVGDDPDDPPGED